MAKNEIGAIFLYTVLSSQQRFAILASARARHVPEKPQLAICATYAHALANEPLTGGKAIIAKLAPPTNFALADASRAQQARKRKEPSGCPDGSRIERIDAASYWNE
jgi:hypothetical protein